jgi:hypothetical protein
VRVNTSGFIVEIVDFEPTLVRMWSPVVIGIGKTVGELHFACHLLASAAERLGPELVALYGGQTLFDSRQGLPSHLDDRAVSPLLEVVE